MKLACSSTTFSRALDAGRLTQLEWLDSCARELNVDGVLFEATHFPRTDDDYVAQVKKLSTDLGLTVAGLECDGCLGPGGPEREETASRWLDVACGLGAPLIMARCPKAASGADWTALVARSKAWATEAKRRNVTIALRNAVDSACASIGDLKRLQKDVDSSWLRFGLDVAALEPSEHAKEALPRTVIAVYGQRKGETAQPALAHALQTLASFRGFLVIETGDGDPSGSLVAALRFIRCEIARGTLSARP